MKKKITALLLCFVLMIGLCACGKSKADIRGDWLLSAMSSGDETVYSDTLESMSVDLPTLTCDGETFTLTISGYSFTGTVSDLEDDEEDSGEEKSYDHGYYLSGDSGTGDFVAMMRDEEPDTLYLVISNGEDVMLYIFTRQ